MNNVDNNKNKKRNVPDLTDKGTGVQNVPKLRFPEFHGEWEETALKNISAINPKSATLNDSFIYIDLESVEKGVLKKEQIVRRLEAPSRAQRVVEQGDILYQCVRPYQRNNYIHEQSHDNDKQWVASTGYAQIRTSECPHYLYHLVNTDSFNKKVIVRCTGSNYPAINSEDLSTIRFYYTPIKEEQEKIANLLSLLDERIATQNALIDRLQSLIKGLGDELLYNKTWAKIYLKDILAFYPTNSLSWDKLSDENESDIRNLHYGIIHNLNSPILDLKMMPFIKWGCIPQKYELCQNGDVAFADASEDTDEIAKVVEFRKISNEEQAVCGLHTIHGRDIHDITVVGFKGYALNAKYFHQQIKRMAQGTKVFSITASNISNCFVFLPSKEEQKKIVSILDAISLKFQVEAELLNLYKKQKQYLLRQMFI